MTRETTREKVSKLRKSCNTPFSHPISHPIRLLCSGKLEKVLGRGMSRKSVFTFILSKPNIIHKNRLISIKEM